MSKKIKVGVIGTGMIGKLAHLEGYSKIPDLCEIAAICDIDAAIAREAADKFSVSTIYDDYKKLLADPEIEAVSVCTPNVVHRQPVIDALAAGKHVICEKPLAMNAEEAKKMCRAAKESGKILQVAFQSRFTSGALFLSEFIKNGHMGDIQYARAQALRRRGVPHWGVFINKELQGGGPLIDIGVHILDLTLHFMGYPKPVSATGKTWNSLGVDPNIKNFWGEFDRSKFTVEDFAVGMIRFENGAVVTLESSFMANMEGPDPIRTQLFGTKAGAIYDVLSTDLKIFKETDGQYFDMKPQNMPKVESPYHGEIEAFVKAILAGDKSPVPGENGLILNAVFDAIYKSSVTGHEEPVDVSY